MAVDPKLTSPPQVPVADGIVCPFCAHVRGVHDASLACPKCTMEDTVGTRRSTGERIGPWFVLQRKNPTAPGLKFSVLLTLARRGHVTARSIVRGPTTGQLWRFASEVKGLSRMFGICWHCAGAVSPDATMCPKCKSAQEIPDDPDVFLESHSSLPLMRELPASPANGFSSGDAIGTTIATTNGESLPASPRREPARRPSPGLNDLADLTRALAIQRPAEPEPTRGARRVPPNEMRTMPAAMNGGGEPILSASDLAAAFQLDGPRPSAFKRARRAAWSAVRVTIVFLIVVALGAAAVGYMKPSWKEIALERAKPFLDRASSWWNQAYTLVAGESKVEAPPPDEMPNRVATDVSKTDSTQSTGVVPPATPIRLDDGKLASDEVNPKGTNDTKRDVPDQTPSVVDAGERAKPQAATDGVKPEAEKPKVEPEKPAVAKVDPPTETPKVEAPKVESSPPANGAHELPLDEAIAQANELRNSALDAEARKDWRAAVVIYEQIGTLPEAARPSDLKVRLALAREQLGK